MDKETYFPSYFQILAKIKPEFIHVMEQPIVLPSCLSTKQKLKQHSRKMDPKQKHKDWKVKLLKNTFAK